MRFRDKLKTAGVTLALASAMFGTLCAFAAGVSRTALRAWLVVVLLMLPMPSHAEDHDRSPVAVASFAAGLTSISLSAADALITYRSVSDGRAREANPLLVPFVRSHGIGKTMVGKFAVDAGVEGVLRYISHRYPERRKTVFIARLAADSMKAYVVVHNLHVLRGTK